MIFGLKYEFVYNMVSAPVKARCSRHAGNEGGKIDRFSQRRQSSTTPKHDKSLFTENEPIVQLIVLGASGPNRLRVLSSMRRRREPGSPEWEVPSSLRSW